MGVSFHLPQIETSCMGFLDENLSIQDEASAKNKKKRWHIANMLLFLVPASIIQLLAHNFIFNA